MAADQRHHRGVADLVVLLEPLDPEHDRTPLGGNTGLDRLRPRAPVDLRVAPAARVVPRMLRHRLHLDPAVVAHAGTEVVAARAEVAALGPLVRQRQLAADRHQRARGLVGAGQRDRGEQAARVGMAHLVEHLLDRADLDRLARVHHADPIAGLEDQAEVVRDVDHRGAEARADLLDQLDDAGLDRDVERGRRLVEQQQRRVRQQRHRDHHALLLAARDLVRIGLHDARRVRQPHVAQHLERARVGALLGAALLMVQRHFHQLPRDLHRRVERGHRLLIDHRDLRAAQLAQLVLAHRGHVAALELDLAGHDAAVLAHVLHDRERHGRLAAAELADDADRLAGHHGQIEVDDRRDLARAREIGDAEVPALENRGLIGHQGTSVSRAGSSRAGRRRAG